MQNLPISDCHHSNFVMCIHHIFGGRYEINDPWEAVSCPLRLFVVGYPRCVLRSLHDFKYLPEEK